MPTWGSKGKQPLRYSTRVPFEGLTGALDSVVLPSPPQRYIPLGCYLEIEGTAAPTDPDTDSLLVRVGTDALPNLFGGASSTEVMGQTGEVGFGSAPGFRGADVLKMFLHARLSPDTDGDLTHIEGITAITFVLWYLPA